jgi:hypothetical protein
LWGSRSWEPTLQAAHDFCSLLVSSQPLQSVLLPAIQRSKDAVHALLPRLARARCLAFLAEVGAAATRLAARPDTVDAFAEHLKDLQACETEKKKWDQQLDDAEDYCQLCEVRDFAPVPLNAQSMVKQSATYLARQKLYLQCICSL